MQYRWTAGSWAEIGTAIVSLVVAAMIWHRRRTPGAIPLMFLMLAAAQWAFFIAFETAALSLSGKIFWSKIAYLGTNAAPVLLLLFAARYTHRDRWLTPRRLALLWMLPAAHIAMAATNDYHGLVWKGFSWSPIGANLLVYEHGAWFPVVVGTAYLYVLTATILLARTALRSATLHRRQSAMILLACVVPWAGNILYVFQLTPLPGFDLTPIAFAVSGAIIGVAIGGLRLFDLVPVARDALVEGMTDGVFVLDRRGRLVDVNPAASRFIPNATDRIGESAEHIFGDRVQSFGYSAEAEPSHLELLWDPDAPLYVDARAAPLRDRRGRPTGRLLLLRDATMRYRAQQALERANKKLQDQLQKIEALQEKLREEAIRDPLTELFNRRYLEETFPRELAEAERSGQPLAIVMLDIDHFKVLNDTYGHHAGDLVLQGLGQVLADGTRAGDLACRYGGEEFILVLPGVPVEAAVDRAADLRQAFADLLIGSADGTLSATLSAGVAAYPEHGRTPEELIATADAALYDAKAAGRNCIRVAAEPTPPGRA